MPVPRYIQKKGDQETMIEFIDRLLMIAFIAILALINAEKIIRLKRRVKELERKDATRTFSGPNSRELWAEINAIDSVSTGDDIHDVIYSLVCKLQEHEASNPITLAAGDQDEE